MKPISDMLASGSYLELINDQRGGRVRTVNFYDSLVRETFQECRYKVLLDEKLGSLVSRPASGGPGNKPLTCIFPNTKRAGSEIISSTAYRSLDAFNHAINDAFLASIATTDTAGAVKLAVCYGDHVYVCKDISDTVYIVWASHVMRTNVGHVANTLYANVPLLINMDGKMRTKSIFVLKEHVQDRSDCDRMPITAGSPVLCYRSGTCPFVREVRVAERAPPQEIRTVTRQKCLATVTAPTKEGPYWYRRDANPFERSIDDEVAPEGATSSLSEGVEMCFEDPVSYETATMELMMPAPAPGGGGAKECDMGPDPFKIDASDGVY